MPVERFKAEVDADIKRFKRKMVEVDRQMRELATGVSVEINASINEFVAKVQQVQAQLQQLDATQATVEIEAILNDFMQDILRAKALAQDLDKESIKIKVHLDMDVFYTQILMVQAELAALGNSSTTATVNLNAHTGGAIADLTTVETLLAAIRDVTIDIRADISDFLAGVVVVDRQSKKIKKNIVIKIWADYTNAMESYATTVRAFAEAGQQMIGGALLSLVPALSQFLSVIVGLIGSLGVMIGVLAGQLLILASALSIAALGFVGLAAVAIPTIKKLFDENAKLNAEQKRAKASWDAFKSTYNNLVKATETPVLQAFTSAMQSAQKILQSLSPMIESVAQSTARLMDAFNKSIDSQPIQKIFETFNKYGSSIFENFVTGIGHLVAGLGSLIAALAPAAEAWSKNFNGMMKSFASWADGLSQSESLKAFIDYVQTYMPVISDIFGNLTMGIVAFFSAFADMGGSFMTSLAEMTERFRTWAETLGENQQFQQFLAFIQASTPAVLDLLSNLWDLIINLGIAFAPMGAAVLDAANAFFEWFNNLLQTNQNAAALVALFPVVLGVISALAPIVISVVSVFGNLIGVFVKIAPHLTSFSTIIAKVTPYVTKFWSVISKLGGVFTWLVSPIGLVVAAIGLIIGVLVLAYNKVEWFRDFVNEAWSKIATRTKEIFGKIAKDISEALTTIVNFGKKQLEKFKGFWAENGKEIMDIVSKFGVVIVTGLSLAMNTILTIVQVGWALISAAFKIAWTLISSIIDIGVTLILGIVSAGMALLQGDWKKAWNIIVDTAKSIGSIIVKTFQSIIDSVKQAGVDIVNGLISGITSMFGSVATALGKLTDKIPQWVKSALGIHSPSRVMAAIAKWIPAGIAKGILDSINLVKSASKEMADAVVPDFSKEIKASQAQIEGAQKAVSRVIAQNNSEIKELERKAAKEIYDINSKLAKDVQGVSSKASKAKSKTAKSGSAEIVKAQRDASNKILGINRKLAEETRKINDSVNADKLQALQEYVDVQKELYGLSAVEEAAYWKYASTAFKDGTDDKLRALNKYQDAYKRAMQEQFSYENELIDQAVKYNAMSFTDKLQAYEQYMKQYKVGSEEQIAYEEKIYDAKKEMYDRLKSLADDYLAKVKTIYDELANEEKRLRDEFQQTYDARVDTLKNTWGLFDEVSLTKMVEYDDEGNIKKQIDLLQNMRDQVGTLRGWMNDLFTLEAQGLDKGLIEELQQLGPKSAAEIKALSQMTASQLDEYQMLWQTKTEMAKKQATKELESARLKMEDEIQKLNSNAGEKLKELQDTFEKEVKALRYGAEGEFNLMSASLPEIGVHAVQGLIDGLTSMKGKLQDAAKSMANSLKNTLQTTLDIQGSIKGATKDAGASLASWLQNDSLQTAFAGNNFTSASSQYFNQELVQDVDYDKQPINVIINQDWNGEEVESYLVDRSAKNLQLKTFKKG
ncbi:hypothetical protein [Lysinibacillus piscis]|uniref:Tape measure protein n=1 Tax=Lysinibacillus piscis TaxID=2518931 RepID=A0ABQ5NMT1_9BACI|nr:hypothetical protein [Lysinibacillus sp. KH24]GLC89329.1 hypothetical protein LYSBPC_24560 [Lysinibacillus sp. KH24]